jgi:hypothetical protein
MVASPLVEVWMIRWQVAAVVLAMASVMGCGNAELDEAKSSLARWNERGPSDYVYVIERQCFCLPEGPSRVVVEDGQVRSAERVMTGEATTGVTMTELLEIAVRQAGNDYEHFAASYDPELGYLKHIESDVSDDYSDDESAMNVTCFAAGASEEACR